MKMKSVYLMSVLLGMTMMTSQSYSEELIKPSANLFGYYSGISKPISYDKNCRMSRWKESDNCIYYWNLFSIYDAPERLSSTPVSLQFLGVTSDGAGLSTELVYKNDSFAKVLPSGKNTFRIRAEWKLSTCDDHTINNKIVGPDSDIKEIIQEFSRYDFSRYMQCNLHLERYVCSELADSCHTEETVMLSLLDVGDISMEFVDRHNNYRSATQFNVYFRPLGQIDLSGDLVVKTAAETFAGLIKSYGNTLLNLRSVAPKNRAAALAAFIGKNRSKFQDALATINQNLDRTSLITKLSVISTINRGYSYVHYLEAKIQGSFLLDEMVITP